jgi:uncharacterized spore protein YtfJ
MDAKQVFQQLRDSFTASTVFGDPIDREGVTLVPVARIFGGGGGGQGQAHHTRGQAEGENLPTHGEGWGGGYGGMAHAAGAYVIRNGDVRWQPVVDVNRVILGAQIVGATLGAEVTVIVAALVFRGLFRSVFRS